MTGGPTRADAASLDADDPLARFRDEFVIAPGLRYLDGNSLGRLPRRTVARLRHVVEAEWGRDLVRAWPRWIDQPTRVGDQLGALIGAGPGQTVVADSTTVNLHKLAHAAFDLRPGRGVVVTEADGFPTDRYVLGAVARSRGGTVRTVAGLSPEQVGAAVDERTAVLALSLVDYRTGEMADLTELTRIAHHAGALVLWDLSHAAGAVEVDLDRAKADLAVGCTYKYLNAGPGAPAFAYVARAHVERIHPVIPGWFGHADPFAMAPVYEPAAGIGRLLSGTPDVRGIAAVEEGVALLAAAGLPALRAKGLALTDLVMACADAWLPEVEVVTPRPPRRRGGHVALRHPEAWQLCKALIEIHAVVPDFREPDIVRLGPAPICTSFAEVWDAMDALHQLMASGEHCRFPTARSRVT